MKLSWGTWIVFSFVAFALFIATLVTVCVSQDVNLVSETYYADELVYQEQWQRLKNAQQLALRPAITVKSNLVTIDYADVDKMKKAKLVLIRPSDQDLDQHVAVPASSSSIVLPIKSLSPGMYRAQLSWTQEDKEYFIEELIYI